MRNLLRGFSKINFRVTPLRIVLAGVAALAVSLISLAGCDSGKESSRLGAGAYPQVSTNNRIMQSLAETRPAKYHEVAAGETVSQIARQYQMEPWRIIQANYLGRGNQIDPGQKLLIPSKETGPAAYVLESTSP
ncbi:MAG: LysM peptidoglycan-binding domain-containing protein [Planctomycetes bacterium]|nr:LysM peptidoglycan-binding domain-containing protein [Planctomycetota bacterium]